MKLDIQKWNPWNWFKHEEKEQAGNVPVRREAQGRGGALPSAFQNDPLWNIHREIDRMFEDVFSSFGAGRLPRLMSEGSAFGNLQHVLLKPSVDIKENRKNYEITVEVPGVDEGDVKLELADGALMISGEKKHEKEEKDEHYHSLERSYGSFKRVIALPEDVNEDGIEAKFKNGVLTITLPRKEIAKPKDDTKVIDIKKAA